MHIYKPTVSQIIVSLLLMATLALSSFVSSALPLRRDPFRALAFAFDFLDDGCGAICCSLHNRLSKLAGNNILIIIINVRLLVITMILMVYSSSLSLSSLQIIHTIEEPISI